MFRRSGRRFADKDMRQTKNRERVSIPQKRNTRERSLKMHANLQAPDPFCIAGTTIGSRLLLGTAGYPNQRILRAAVEASGAEIVTVSIRRISLNGHGSDTIGDRKRTRLNSSHIP